MIKRMIFLIYLILLLMTSSLLSVNYFGEEEVTTRSMLLTQSHTLQQDAPKQNIAEDSMQWTHTYGHMDDDSAMSIIQTTDSGYAFTGVTGSWPNDEAWLVKTDARGKTQWIQTYNFSYARSVIQTSDGGYALAGTRGGWIGSSSEALLVKTDAYGVEQWNQTYNWYYKDQSWSIIQTNDGGFLMGGSSSEFRDFWDGWLVKTDSNGNFEWNKIYGGSDHDHIHTVIQTLTGYAFAGDSYSYGVGFSDFWLAIIDDRGEMKWNRTYGGSEFETVYSLIQMPDGSFTLAGATTSYGAGDWDAWLVKTDIDGNLEWNRTYGGFYHDNAYSGIRTTDNGFVLVGATKSYSENPEDFDLWMMKLDSRGELQWNQTYGGERSDEANDIILTTDGGFILAGRTRSYGRGDWDAWLMKTDAWGVVTESEIPQIDWFVIGLLGFLTFTATAVVVIYVRRVRSQPKWQ